MQILKVEITGYISLSGTMSLRDELVEYYGPEPTGTASVCAQKRPRKIFVVPLFACRAADRPRRQAGFCGTSLRVGPLPLRRRPRIHLHVQV